MSESSATAHFVFDREVGFGAHRAPLVRVKAKFSVKNAVCCRRQLLAYGIFDCDFHFGSREWSCSKWGCVQERLDPRTSHLRPVVARVPVVVRSRGHLSRQTRSTRANEFVHWRHVSPAAVVLHSRQFGSLHAQVVFRPTIILFFTHRTVEVCGCGHKVNVLHAWDGRRVRMES